MVMRFRCRLRSWRGGGIYRSSFSSSSSRRCGGPGCCARSGIVELLDGPIGPGATGVFADAANAARSSLAASTIADVAEREARDAGAAMYYI
jgi:hypothetical protein